MPKILIPSCRQRKAALIGGIHWNSPSSSDTHTPDYTFGTDLQTGAYGDLNGDTKLDWMGVNNDQLYQYINVT
jgi:hypothetical protein